MTLAMNQISINEAEASKLLDFNQKFDIGLLDRVVGSLYQGQGQQVCKGLFYCSMCLISSCLISSCNCSRANVLLALQFAIFYNIYF